MEVGKIKFVLSETLDGLANNIIALRVDLVRLQSEEAATRRLVRKLKEEVADLRRTQSPTKEI